MTEINFSRIEKKWQDKWEKEKVFEINGNSKKEKYYLLEMFPYPSASGLHMGHALNYSIGDVMARFKRMNGFEVFYPMGFDALGLPAENAAIKVGEHPKSFTEKSIKNYIRQMKNLGLSYDWTKTLATMHSEYYRWNQYFFLKFLEAGLIYRKKASVNWCPSCNTVISNEQAQGGICERCKSKIEIRHLEEWYLRTTKYADELLEGLDGLDWSDKIKAMQRNWIGKSHGIEIDFEMENKKEKIILVDAVHCLIDKDGNINLQLKRYLDSLKNKKIILTNAPLEKHDLLFKNVKDYEIFTLENNPNKKDPEYYKKFLEKFNLSHLDVVYFEHDRRNVESAKSVGIKSFFYQNNLEDIKNFINNNLNEKWPIFTTRPDTIFGVTFMVVSAQHEKLMSLVTDGQKKAVEKFLKNLGSVSEKEMIDLEKEGVFTGSYAINPANGEKIPVYAGNFVVADYGSGMIMAVPAHDQRDFGFAKKYKIEVKQVISGNLTKTRAWTGEGELINSGEFNKIDNVTAKKKITSWMIKKKVGRKVVNYKLRDWGFSRQRYWGTPIPIIHCKKCGLVPVPEEDLPVVLPEKVKFGRGNPLTTNEKWINVNCPKCGGAGKRETETMDTFFDSSWYFLRYPDNRNNKKPFDKKKIEKWLPVDQYIGGAEHACMHLIYARFFTKALRDLKFLDFDEPFKALFNQGMLHGPDGEKMSKSKGNIINPDEISKKYGMDSARYFLLSLAAPDKPRNWSEKGIQGSLRFIRKIFSISENITFGKSSDEFVSKLSLTTKDVTEFYKSFQYRKATIKLKELFDLLIQQKEVSKEDFEISLKLLSPICPHIAEELWEKLGNEGFISMSEWPKIDVLKVKKEKGVDLNSKIIEDVKYVLGKVGNCKVVYLYVMPFELGKVDVGKIRKVVGKKVEVFAVNDSGKFDPEGKAKRAKPGKVGIYLK